MPKPVVIESPFAGETILERQANELYALRALDDSLARDEAPFASHLLYPRVLDDNDAAQRRQGIEGQLAWIDLARSIVVYIDRGLSPGMIAAIRHSLRQGYELVFRTLDGALAAWLDEQLETAIPVRELFESVPLQSAARRTVRLEAPAPPAPILARDDLGQGEAPAAAPGPPPAPVARPDGPASAWESRS